MTSKKKTATFEEDFKSLEKILEKMNSSQASLDDSLKLFEEADVLIGGLNERLSEAEEKIEVLLKKRNGSVELDENNNPLSQTLDI